MRLGRRWRSGGGLDSSARTELANISITRRCRRRCRYCFAKHERARDLVSDMPPDIYEAALAFLERSGASEARLLGGEPTEHPLFCEYVTRALEQGFKVLVFSGGLIPQQAFDFLVDLPVGNILVVLNSADPATSPGALVNRQREICRALGEKVTLGFNVASRDEDPTFLFDWVDQYGLSRTIRLGLAHPIWGADNECFQLRGPRHIPLLERLVAIGTEMGIRVGFDCGFTPCMFSPEFVDSQADMFMRNDVGHGAADRLAAAADDSGLQSPVEAIGVRCTPVVDILPEGDCIACFALSRFCRLPLSSEGKRDDLVSSLEYELASALPVGVYRECARCGYRAEGMCSGGCRARRARRLRPNSLALLDPEPAHGPATR